MGHTLSRDFRILTGSGWLKNDQILCCFSWIQDDGAAFFTSAVSVAGGFTTSGGGGGGGGSTGKGSDVGAGGSSVSVPLPLVILVTLVILIFFLRRRVCRVSGVLGLLLPDVLRGLRVPFDPEFVMGD